MTGTAELVQLIRTLARSVVRPLERMIVDGVVDSVEGSYTAVRIGDPSSQPLPGFWVSPSMRVVAGDHVLCFRLGGYPVILLVLSRNALAVPEPGLSAQRVLAAGSNNDIPTVVGTDDVEYLLLSGDAGGTSVLSGLADGRRGKVVKFAVADTGQVAVSNNDSVSAETNRVLTPTGASVTFAIGATGLFWWDHFASRWRLMRG